MNATHYWIIGGEYTDTRFHEVVDGTQSVFGPFASYEEARRAWREAADDTRADCHVRFTIVQEAAGA